MLGMPMRADCRHYESRTYDSGEVVRRCKLDLAPEAPWRCPDDCPSFTRRRMDAGWHYGSLRQDQPARGHEPAGEDVAALFDAAEEIVNTAAPDILADFASPKRRKLRRRKGKKGK
jgi:hypothetical protein